MMPHFSIRLPFISFMRPAAQSETLIENPERTDLRREYIHRFLASDSCVGEYGAQALMGLFPKDF